ncbi:MAG TPA: hypothetical protein VEC14_14145 [Reyranellaceae bacterium]|nr:hypothetical protein [Reyranellaceae bacterium]
MNSWLKQHGLEWIYRVLVICGLAAIAWLNSRFATHADLQAIDRRVTAIETAIRVMVETNKVNDRQDEFIKDHEQRLRALEQKAALIR